MSTVMRDANACPQWSAAEADPTMSLGYSKQQKHEAIMNHSTFCMRFGHAYTDQAGGS